MHAVDSEPLQVARSFEPPPAVERVAGAAPERIVIPIVGRPSCPLGQPGEIVVCALDQEEFRLRPLAETYEEERGPGGLRADLGDGVTLQQDLEQVGIGGTPSKRIMVRAKIKF